MARKGVGLGSTLLVVTIVALLAFALAASSVTHLNLMARDANASLALDRARSAIDLTLAHLYTDINFGQAGETVTSSAADGSTGWVTFDSVKATQLGVGPSLSNLSNGTAIVAPDGQTVPVQGVYLQALGEANGVKRRVTAVLAVPPFPYAIATDGPIAVGGRLVVGSLSPGQSPTAPTAQLKPADLASNDSQTAIDLGPNSIVRGSLKAVGGVRVDPSSTVNGRQLTGQAPITVPNMMIDSFDPANLGQSSATLQPNYQSTTFTGALRRNGNVNIDGDLNLNHALVFVRGDLSITGSVSGDGVLVCSGDLTVGRQATIAATQRVAILAGGSLTLEGNGPASSNVRGLLYAENGISAKQVLVEGAIVARRPPSVHVEDLRVAANGSLLQAPFTVAVPGAPNPQPVAVVNFSDGSVTTKQSLTTGGVFTLPPGGTESTLEVYTKPDGNLIIRMTQVNPQPPPGTEPTVVDNVYSSADELAAALQSMGLTDPQNVNAPDPVVSSTGSPGSSFPLSLDPSKVLPLEERTRVLLWHET